MSSDEWTGDGEAILAPYNYQLVLDNQMDPTHEKFLHSSSIGQDEPVNPIRSAHRPSATRPLAPTRRNFGCA